MDVHGFSRVLSRVGVLTGKLRGAELLHEFPVGFAHMQQWLSVVVDQLAILNGVAGGLGSQQASRRRFHARSVICPWLLRRFFCRVRRWAVHPGGDGDRTEP